MRSARYFAADNGISVPKREAKEASGDEDDEETEATAEEGNQNRPAREQRRKPDWFLHDDRDMDPGPARRGGDTQGKENQRGRNQRGSGWEDTSQDARGGSGQGSGRRGGRGERAAKPHVPGRTLPLLPPSSAWHYIDPEGKEQGPFDAKKLVNWVDLGYFGQGDLQVKKAGKDAWVSLSSALPQIRKEAVGDFSSSYERSKEPVRMADDDQPSGGRGRGRGAEQGGPRTARPVRRPQQEVDDLLPVMPQGRRHPAEGLLSPREEAGPVQRRGAAHVTPGPEQPSRAENYPRGEQASRGGRGRGKASRGGRSARPDNAGLDSRASQGTAAGAPPGRGADLPKPKRAWKLFSAERKGTELPMWRYIDPDGQVQGPFSATEMLTWYESNYLQMELPTCGMERMVSPPDLPPKELYKPLGELLQQVDRGHKFRPVTVKEVAAAKNTSQAQESTSNDDAESVEAKQEASGPGQRDGADTGSNQDAESVTAREDASEDDSDMEEGEIEGRTAATDEESNFDPDEDDGSVSPPRRHVQNQAASDTESPERPVSPQKGEARAAFRRPASPEPAPEAASAAQPPASPGKPSSPVKPASPERPEVYAGRSHAAGSRQAAARSPPPERAAKISMPDELTTAADSHKPAQAAQLSAGNMIVEEPEEEEQVAAKQATQEKQEAEQQTNGGGSQESMQIEEVSQAGTETSTEQEGSGGVVQSVVGAARSLFGAGKADQQDKAKDGGDVGVQQAQEPPTVEYPDTTESEATLDSHHSDHGTFEVHEASRSNSGAEDVGPADDSVAHVEDGLSKVSLNDQ